MFANLLYHLFVDKYDISLAYSTQQSYVFLIRLYNR